MKRTFEVGLRLGFLIIYLSSFVYPLQVVNAAQPLEKRNGLSASLNWALPLSNSLPTLPAAESAPGPEPAPGGFSIADQAEFASQENAVLTGPFAVGENAPAASDPLSGLYSPAASAPASTSSSFASGLTIIPIAAYNLIVDSNVLAPSSYGPNSATLGAQYCNTSAAPLTDVWAYIGNRTANTPGVYPVITPAQAATNTGNAALASVNTTDFGSTVFSLKHEGGTLGVTDATRYIGTLQPGECRTQYWLVTYPRMGCTNGQPCNTSNGTRLDLTGGVKPDDDLWLQYDFWGRTGATTEYYTRYLTLRNEISAMANKIWPNGDNKVPDEYVAAIQQVTGWSTWTPGGTGTAYPGQTATSQGIWYDFGNIGAGFDNNYDFTPDRNAWVQPIGDATTYDPGCFRLTKTYGLVIVKLNDGTELLIPFVDQMYFENIPGNNTGAVGLVYYEYAALDGACSAGLTPYQEVASGYDNEKFNADFGAGIPPLQSQQTNMTISKTGPNSVATNTAVNYSITFALPESTSPSLFLTIGAPSVGMPLVIEETIPSGMAFISPVSPTVTMTNYASPTLTASLLYSTDSGTTWSATAPANGTLSTSPNNLIKIQWWMPSGINQNTQGNGTVTGTVSFSATSPNTTTPPPAVTNTACLQMGNGPDFTCGSKTTLITGVYSLSGTVFCDDGTQTSASGPCSTGTAASTLGNGILDAGGGEPGMPNVSVYLYYDSNSNGNWDATDLLVNNTTVTDASGNYSFTNLSNGTYFTQVVKTDGDVQATYGITTPETRIGVIANANVTGLDFGFAPPLSLEKTVNKTTGFGGDTFTYTITLNNNLPGSGLPGNACVYRAWAGQANASGGTPPGGGPANSQWQNASNSTGRPDGQYATTVMSNNSDEIGLTRFNIANMGGNITSVGYRIVVNELLRFDDDTMIVDIYDGATIRETDTYSVVGSGSGIETFTGPTGKQYVINGTITWAPAGGWTFSDFSSAVNRFGIRVTGNRNGGTSGDLALDAVAFTITTDQTCSGVDTTLDPVPLTDIFRNDHFALVSTNPPYDGTSVSGNQTTISWNNVGPIYPGGYQQVTVVLRALDPGPAGASSPNTAQSTNAKFTNGLNANSPVVDAVTVLISDTTSISQITGRIFDDNDGDGWAFSAACTAGTTNPNCSVEAGDTALQGIKVNLLACVNTSTNLLVTVPGSNKTCAEQGGEWRTVASQFTDSTGQYLFTLLPQGFYRVQVDTSTLPGSTNTADPNVSATNGTPFVCASCDNQTYGNLRLDNLTFGAITGANSFYSLNFGYNIPAGAFNLGDTIYYDWNGNGVQDTGEEGIDGAIVQLLRADGSVYATSPATVDGAYLFTGLPSAVYTVRVVDSSLPSFVSQTADPDQPATTCSVCDSASTIALTANNLTRDFGYKPYGTAIIGDTVWKDMNGDGVKSGAQEIGISNITVNLLTDFDNNGTWVTAMTTTTNASGVYQFSNLPDGTYRVQVDTSDADLPNDAFGFNYVPTNGSLYTSITVVNGVVTSMTNQASGVTSTTANGFGDAVENDPLNLDADFGFAPLAAIGDTIYWDNNSNGTQDVGELGISGVKVDLYTFNDLPDGQYNGEPLTLDVNGNGRYDPGDTYVDAGNGRYDVGEALSPMLATTTTDANGRYIFSGLDTDKNGVNYVVVVDKANSPVIASATLTGDPNTDGFSCLELNNPADPNEPALAVCDNREGMKLFPGSSYMGADFGYQPVGAFGDTVWLDSDNDGIVDIGEAGIPDIQVTATTTVPVGATIRVGSTTYTAGQVINLSTSTDANGNYSFADISPSTTVTWTVTVNTADPDFPAGLTNVYDPDVVYPTTGNSTTLVTMDSSGNVTLVGALNNGTADGDATDPLKLDVDFGYDYVGNGTLSGTVCLDAGYTTDAANAAADNIGVCGTNPNIASGVDTGAGEVAYDNVTVFLYRWNWAVVDGGNGDNVIDPGEMVQIASTNTNTNGDYSFANIPDGIYYVVAIGAPQSGLELTTKTNDSNNVGNGDTRERVVENNPSQTVADTSAYQVVSVPSGGGGSVTVNNVDFAFATSGAFDYGDLPDTYATTLQGVPDGPRHNVLTTPTLYLGTAPNNTQALMVDTNGQPSTDASGDGADEDGVTFSYDTNDANWADGVQLTLGVTAYVAAPTSGSNNDAYLVAWMDFNHDGDFNDAGEMIINRGIENGLNTINVSVPAGALPHASGTINSRFRLFANSETPPLPTLAFSGAANNGEVEDYQNRWEMTIDKDTSTPTVIPGGTATYTIVIRNAGNQVLSNVQFSDTLPGSGQAWAWTYTGAINHTESGAGTNFTSDECVDGLNLPDPVDADANTVECGKWNIGSGGFVTITLTVSVPANTPLATYDNTALASSAQTGTIDDDGVIANDPGTPTSPTSDPEDDEDVTVITTYTISGQVRNDTDNDGDLGDAESGLAGASVALFTDPNGDGDPADGAQVGTSITTDGTGNFSFTGLNPGNYVLVETNPTNFISTADSAAPNNDRIPVVITNANVTNRVFLDWLNARIQIVKSPSATVINSGGSVTYSYVVTNLGAVTLTGINVTDDKCSPVNYVNGDTNNNIALETTEIWNYNCTTTLTATTTNLATVTGRDPLNNLISDTDTATVNVVTTGLTKIIPANGTSETFTTGNNVAIGEIVTYEITIPLPAGLAFNNVTVTDVMDKGLVFVNCEMITVAGVDRTATICPPPPPNPPAQPVVSSVTNPGDSPANLANPGRQVQFNIGNIPAPGADTTIFIRYRAIVLDVLENQQGVSLNNNVTWAWTGGSLSTSAPNVTIVEPDLNIDKSATPTSAVPIGTPITFTLSIAHTAQSTADAFDVEVTDILPATLEYIPCTITYVSGPAPTTPANPALDAALCPGTTANLTFRWDVIPLGSAPSVITFNARLVTSPATNSANVAWTSLPIDPGVGGLPVQLSAYNVRSTERWYDPLDDVNIYSVSDSVTINPATGAVGGGGGSGGRGTCPDCVKTPALPTLLPATGFAPNRVTNLPEQPAEKAYRATEVWLEVPRLGLKMPIVGVPLYEDDWDVSWLWKEAGWLEGTAFPSWQGNSVLTSHVTLANGEAGPFAQLGKLKYGDHIIVRAYGMVYTYEVRQNRTISPNNTSVLGHEDKAWLTLLTCKTYIEATDSYADRIAVRAVLIRTAEDKTSSGNSIR